MNGLIRCTACVGFVVYVALAPGSALAAETEPTAAQIDFFESKVRPLLAKNCFECHGGDNKIKGGLRLDSRADMISGGESGPAIVPGKPDESLLIEAVRYDGFEMPPSGRLKDREIAVLVEWVNSGAAWPNDKPRRANDGQREQFRITDDDRAYWAFQPIGKPPLPEVKQTEWVTNPIDTFILSRLEEKGFQPNRQADKRTLIRRAYFDLIGLPPTPEEIDAFLADDSPDAWERLIDDLLQREQYGERWGRHWLDVVRYGQTNGYERDTEKPFAWRFRDYVIDSFNSDKPYNRFVREQLAGDELDDVTHDSIIATGFYRLGVWDDEPDDKRAAEFDELDEIIRTTGSSFLGLTLGCARCHSHMFDPIGHDEYYQLLAYFRNVMPFGTDISSTTWKPNPDAILTPLIDREQSVEWEARKAELQQQIDDLQAKLKSIADGEQQESDQSNEDAAEAKKSLEAELKRANEALAQTPFAKALSVRETGVESKPTHVLIRGNADSPGKQVHPKFPEIFDGLTGVTETQPVALKSNELRQLLAEQGVQSTSGLRRQLADWVASNENPLTARVMVNRLWQHHIGRGIVKIANNFGKAGIPPTHPKLLDWLASTFIDGDWKIKRLHKLIMMSSAYQMTSSTENSSAVAIDPGNDLIWRQNMQRLDAEALRDTILAVSGNLNLKRGGPSIYPTLSKDVLATQSRPGAGWGKSDPAERARRSVYIYIKRTLMVPIFETFDYTNTSESLGVRPVTTVAPQALLLLNSQFMREQSQALAQRVMAESSDDSRSRIERLYALSLGRSPRQDEQQIAQQLLSRQFDRFRREMAGSIADSESTAAPDKIDEQARRRAFESLCLVVLNLNEFLFVD